MIKSPTYTKVEEINRLSQKINEDSISLKVLNMMSQTNNIDQSLYGSMSKGLLDSLRVSNQKLTTILNSCE